VPWRLRAESGKYPPPPGRLLETRIRDTLASARTTASPAVRLPFCWAALVAPGFRVSVMTQTRLREVGNLPW